MSSRIPNAIRFHAKGAEERTLLIPNNGVTIGRLDVPEELTGRRKISMRHWMIAKNEQSVSVQQQSHNTSIIKYSSTSGEKFRYKDVVEFVEEGARIEHRLDHETFMSMTLVYVEESENKAPDSEPSVIGVKRRSTGGGEPPAKRARLDDEKDDIEMDERATAEKTATEEQMEDKGPEYLLRYSTSEGPSHLPLKVPVSQQSLQEVADNLHISVKRFYTQVGERFFNITDPLARAIRKHWKSLENDDTAEILIIADQRASLRMKELTKASGYFNSAFFSSPSKYMAVQRRHGHITTLTLPKFLRHLQLNKNEDLSLLLTELAYIANECCVLLEDAAQSAWNKIAFERGTDGVENPKLCKLLDEVLQDDVLTLEADSQRTARVAENITEPLFSANGSTSFSAYDFDAAREPDNTFATITPITTRRLMENNFSRYTDVLPVVVDDAVSAVKFFEKTTRRIFNTSKRPEMEFNTRPDLTVTDKDGNILFHIELMGKGGNVVHHEARCLAEARHAFIRQDGRRRRGISLLIDGLRYKLFCVEKFDESVLRFETEWVDVFDESYPLHVMLNTLFQCTAKELGLYPDIDGFASKTCVGSGADVAVFVNETEDSVLKVCHSKTVYDHIADVVNLLVNLQSADDLFVPLVRHHAEINAFEYRYFGHFAITNANKDQWWNLASRLQRFHVNNDNKYVHLDIHPSNVLFDGQKLWLNDLGSFMELGENKESAMVGIKSHWSFFPRRELEQSSVSTRLDEIMLWRVARWCCMRPKDQVEFLVQYDEERWLDMEVGSPVPQHKAFAEGLRASFDEWKTTLNWRS